MKQRENLNKENFWDELYAKYPEQVQHFCNWIDEYKRRNNWEVLFNDKVWCADNQGEGAYQITQAPKFHHLPIAMQMGIWMEYLEDQQPRMVGQNHENLRYQIVLHFKVQKEAAEQLKGGTDGN
jgi:hypothetical protein